VNRLKSLVIAIFFGVILLFSAHIGWSCPFELPAVQTAVKGHELTIELATTPEARSCGLSLRDNLPANRGMLFVYAEPEILTFWMKNTRIPLDIFYFNRDLALVSVSENTPPCRSPRCPSYPSTGPAKYVLELNAGKAAELGVQAGDVLELHLD